MKKPSASENLAAKTAAAMAAAEVDDDTANTAPQPKRGRGRPPKEKKEAFAITTVRLDEKRYKALAELAEDRGISIHGLILGGIDLITNKPTKNVL